MNEKLKVLSEIFRDVFDDDTIVINEETCIKEIKGYDSLVHVSLIAAVQDEFRIHFDVNEIMAINTVADIISSIENKS